MRIKHYNLFAQNLNAEQSLLTFGPVLNGGRDPDFFFLICEKNEWILMKKKKNEVHNIFSCLNQLNNKLFVVMTE